MLEKKRPTSSSLWTFRSAVIVAVGALAQLSFTALVGDRRITSHLTMLGSATDETKARSFPADPTERSIAATLGSIVHVTHTHTSSNDTWRAAFDSLREHGRDAAPWGESVRFVVCVDREDPSLAREWPWLEIVSYGDNITEGQYPAKVAACLREVSRRHSPKVVLHAMEDMLLTGPVRWALVAAAARVLAGTPAAPYFRLGCFGALTDSRGCARLRAAGHQRTVNATNATSARGPDIDGPGDCGECRAPYPGMFYTGVFSVGPMLVRPEEWIALHERHVARGTGSGSGMETYSYGHPDEPGPGLQGFHHGGGTGHNSKGDAARRFAYPYVHTGVQFGMWMSAYFGESLCPAMEAQGIEEAGAMDCRTDPNATPPCLCDHPTQCPAEGWRRKRKFFKPPDQDLLFPDGCKSWRERGRPRPEPVSPVGPAVEAALRDGGLWDEPGLEKAWASL